MTCRYSGLRHTGCDPECHQPYTAAGPLVLITLLQIRSNHQQYQSSLCMISCALQDAPMTEAAGLLTQDSMPAGLDPVASIDHPVV